MLNGNLFVFNIFIYLFIYFIYKEKHSGYLMDARGLGFQIGVSCRTPEINAQVYHHIRQMGQLKLHRHFILDILYRCY